MGSLLRRFLKAGLALLIFLVLAELGLQAIFSSKRSASMSQEEMQAHLGQGFRYDPDLYWYWDQLPDETAGVNIHGFRRSESMSKIAPDGIRRVIAVGDSQTFGGGVELGQAFPDYAEDALGEGWEVLNAGLSGYRSLNAYRLLRLKLVHYQPDYLLVDCMPKDSPRENGPLAQASVGSGQFDEWVWNSRLYYFSQLMLRVAGVRPWESLPWPLQLHEIRERLVDPSQGDLRNSPDMGNLDLIGHYAAKKGIQAIFMRYPYAENRGTVGCHAWPGSMPEGFPVFDACAALQADGREAKALFIDKNHLTVEGNRVVGKALAQFLEGLEGQVGMLDHTRKPSPR